jgi:hypothetical protein
VKASGKLASVGRSLSGAFSGLRSSSRGSGGDDEKDDAGSGSFDDDDVCSDIAWWGCTRCESR